MQGEWPKEPQEAEPSKEGGGRAKKGRVDQKKKAKTQTQSVVVKGLKPEDELENTDSDKSWNESETTNSDKSDNKYETTESYGDQVDKSLTIS